MTSPDPRLRDAVEARDGQGVTTPSDVIRHLAAAILHDASRIRVPLLTQASLGHRSSVRPGLQQRAAAMSRRVDAWGRWDTL